MNILGCLDVPTSGSYMLDDTIVNGLSRNALADLRNVKLGLRVPGLQSALAHNGARQCGAATPLPARRCAADTRQRAIDALTRVGLGGRLDITRAAVRDSSSASPSPARWDRSTLLLRRRADRSSRRRVPRA